MKEKRNLLEEFLLYVMKFSREKSNEYCDKLIAEVRIKERLINEILKFMKDHQITCKKVYINAMIYLLIVLIL